MVIAYVGSGGKTTLLKKHAEAYRRQGLRVLVTTSTRMFMEEDTLADSSAQAIIRRLEETGYAMAGSACGEKIGPLDEAVYREVCRHADVVLVEADGSKRLPLKFPASHEPVIYDNVDRIIVVCGLQALGKRAADACHRLELVKQCLGIEDETIITADHIQRLILEGYILPLRKKHPEKGLQVYLSGAETGEQIAAMEKITKNTPADFIYC